VVPVDGRIYREPETHREAQEAELRVIGAETFR
jgi:hypothetical protein